MAKCNCKKFRGENDGHLDSCSIYFNANVDRWYYLMLDEVKNSGILSGKFLDLNLNLILVINKYYEDKVEDIYSLVEEDIMAAYSHWKEYGPDGPS